jgi:outer membrane protein OmpA-like peptidoglycan-associated protein
MRRVSLVTLLVVIAACGASVPPPRALEASSATAVRNARIAGAASDPSARLHLEFAEEELENGRALMHRGDHRTATVVLGRARVQADLARSLAAARPAEPVVVAPRAIGGGPVETSPVEETVAPEKPNRDDSQQAAREALDKIAISGAAIVRVDERGTVICVPASSLFVGDAAELAPDAAHKLALVDEALDHSDGHSIVVEGYTDSQGDAASNRDLAQKRAEAVRAHLVARGAPADRVGAKGLGGVRPIADNGTAQGRARNRRIEIVVRPIEEK